MKTLKQWLDLTRASINTSSENHAKIAWFCFADEQSGGQPATWHASAAIHGHKCQCFNCRYFADN